MSDRRFELTTIPTGWKPRDWAKRLEAMATGCAERVPDHAAELRATAAEILNELGAPRVCAECQLELEGGDPGAHPNGVALICTPCEFRNGHRASWSRDRITYFDPETLA